MARVMGVNATAGALWFVLSVDGVLSNPDQVSFTLPAGMDRARALEAGRRDLAEFLQRHKVDRVALAEAAPPAGPPSSRASMNYQSLMPRFTVEVVLEFAAASAGVELVRVSREGIKSALELEGKGSTSDHAVKFIETPLAPHWKKERDVAAMVALSSG